MATETAEEKAKREADEANAPAKKLKEQQAEALARADRYIVDGNIVDPDGKVICAAPK